MDLQQKNGLKVIINQIFDTAPAWFLKQYPESLMVTNDGHPLYPMATACRQMGGTPRSLPSSQAGYCSPEGVYSSVRAAVSASSCPDVLGYVERAGTYLRHQTGNAGGESYLLLS